MYCGDHGVKASKKYQPDLSKTNTKLWCYGNIT